MLNFEVQYYGDKGIETIDNITIGADELYELRNYCSDLHHMYRQDVIVDFINGVIWVGDWTFNQW